MLSNEAFIRYSLELNLFFMRIMKEHAIFMQASLPPKNVNLIREADILKNEATTLLRDIINLAGGIVSDEALNSGEFVTEFTLQAEAMTEYYTGIHIDSRLTATEIALIKRPKRLITPVIMQNTLVINQRAADFLMSIIAFKEKLHNDVLACRVFTTNYPHMLDHIIREAKFYLGMLLRLKSWDTINTERELFEQELFWNDIIKEHAEFIRGGLDPTEEKLINKADMIANAYKQLEIVAENVKAQTVSLAELTRKSIEQAALMKEFNASGAEGILECKIKSILLPLLADHTLRETNHYLRVLNTYKNL